MSEHVYHLVIDATGIPWWVLLSGAGTVLGFAITLFAALAHERDSAMEDTRYLDPLDGTQVIG